MSSLVINKLFIQDKEKSLVDLNFCVTHSTALIGQSGSGKSLTLKSILGLLPKNLTAQFDAQASFELNSNNIGFVPQNPFTSLSPMTKIDQQFFCKSSVKLQMLCLVGLDKWVLNRFPSQLSGGQLQRVVIAIALSTSPKLLLLDEPTTALDSQSKRTIIELLIKLQQELNLLILFVTHDIFSIKDICQEIVIIKDGKIIEQGSTAEILTAPKEAYTKELLSCGFENRAFRQ